MKQLYRHKKRGTTYELVGIARAQCANDFRPLCDDDRVAVYRGTNGKLWVRFEDEFHDGRFENITPVRRWWPSEYLDEVMPQGAFTRDRWLLGRSPAGWVLAPPDRADAHAYGCRIVADGEVVDFSWVEPRGIATITIFSDGTWRGSVPDDFTHCWEKDEIGTPGESVDEAVENILLFDPLAPGDEVDVDLYFCKWGDATFRLVVENQEAKFVPEDAAAYAAVSAEHTAHLAALLTNTEER